MKKILFLLLIFIVASCSKSKQEAPIEAIEANEEHMMLEDEPMIANTEVFTYQHLIEQKLQDYYDLLALKSQHPEFIEDITLQLEELSEGEISITNNRQKVLIKNVKQIGISEQVSDSIQKITIQFDILNDSISKTDSISAIIKTKKIILEDTKVVSTKIIFSKE